MKCPHCNADMQTVAFGPRGMPLFDWGKIGVDDRGLFVQRPETWQVTCPNCRFSGPRQSSKEDAESAVRRLTGPFTLKAIARALKSVIGTHGPITAETTTSAAKRVLGELKHGQSQEA